MNKGIYLKTADIYLRFPEIMEEECNDLAEFLEDEHIVYEGATDIVYNLQQENQELKLELSGYRQAILEDKDMLGLKEENQSLKKQLEEYKHKGLYNTCLPYSTGYKKAIKEKENQQKEFIEYLEYLQKKLNDMHLAPDFEKILSKYKSIIGDKQ